MAEEFKAPDRITFEYKISPNYSVYAISGVHGGLNAHGQIVVNLFNERSAIPKTQTYEVTQTGDLATHPITQDVKSSVIRDVLFGISLTPSLARGIAKWLNDKADQFEKVFTPPKEN